jgi:hypothetical protein
VLAVFFAAVVVVVRADFQLGLLLFSFSSVAGVEKKIFVHSSSMSVRSSCFLILQDNYFQAPLLPFILDIHVRIAKLLCCFFHLC